MRQIVAYIRQSLKDYEADEAEALTRFLCTQLLGFSDKDYFLKPSVTLTSQQKSCLDDAVARLQNNEPIQYIVREADFCGLSFIVTPDVLIPRPETAELVQWIAEESNNAKDLLDIGTGSGCISISLAKKLPKTNIEGWDLSEAALSVASQNNLLNQTSVIFKQQDILHVPEPYMIRRWDVIISNPPYITEVEKAQMKNNVLKWEPSMALFVPNEQPLLFYEAIARYGKQALRTGGSIYFEINPLYSNRICELLGTFGYKNIEVRKDLYDRNRMIKANIE